MATLLDALDAAVNHHMAGRADAAEPLYRRILGTDPAQPDALHLLGVLHAQRGSPVQAVTLIGRSARVRPAAAQPWAHLGAALRAAGRPDDAEAALRRALALQPASADALEALGALLHDRAGYAPARLWLARALAVRPGHAETLLNLGTVLRDLRRFAEAETCFDAVLARQPSHGAAHLARAVGRLVRGDLRAGWEGFEHRWRRFTTPPWAGEPLNGATILLHMEQGFGDAIQFARYAPLVARAGGRVVVETHEALHRLFASLGPSVELWPRGSEPPPHDRHCPLMSLPRAFGTDLERIPASVPYLAPEPADVVRWQGRLDSGREGEFRVGLVWAGNPRHRNDRNRSLPVEALRPLLAVPGVRFLSLQTGDARAALARLPGDGVEDPIDGVRDFADTAALLANLDLLIAVDTSAAHLAGAMGLPVWLLLPFVPDWRWLLDRSDSPWYPSLRLFRQPRPGDWATVLGTVAAVLKAQAAAAQARLKARPKAQRTHGPAGGTP
ncbi:tetratricopeptide repeat protein [Azospirillum agricola]|uniref:tetratricopeptide repeat protein n=1 Tax=Azospirillum agricola TaxID=1720247 RepID=UPI000A0F2610|nr:tetratricopeptide repeat protein [Azospirillum agricola]SMH45340.1 Flp pilus assembly protein TadD, contains TPR repeats [Azospirillum lipoferum]